MNELVFTNAHGLRLITGFEGAPRLKARLCEGGKHELGYGITFDLDGNPFNADSTCTPEYADALFRNALKLFEDGVRELVTVPLNGNQFSGLVALSFNIGLANFASSTVLKRVNENRMDDAAASFGMWIFATRGGRKQAYRGLLRRRYAEACLFLGYDWDMATTDTEATNPVSLQAEAPETLPGTDRVIYKTPFKDILAVAQRYPLVDELVLTPSMQAAPPTATAPEAKGAEAVPPQPAQPQSSPKVSPAPTVLVPPARVEKPAMPTAPSVASQAPVPPVGGVIVTKPPLPPLPVPPPPKDPLPADLANGKDMLLSRRFWGLFITGAGSLQFLPRGVTEWINHENNRELLSWLAVVVFGIIVYQYGKRKATRPLK